MTYLTLALGMLGQGNHKLEVCLYYKVIPCLEPQKKTKSSKLHRLRLALVIDQGVHLRTYHPVKSSIRVRTKGFDPELGNFSGHCKD